MRIPVSFGRQYTLRRWRRQWRWNVETLAVRADGSIIFLPF